MLCQINYYHTIYDLCSVLIVLVCGMTLIAREIAEATTLDLFESNISRLLHANPSATIFVKVLILQIIVPECYLSV